MENPLRVLIVDDTVTYRKIVSEVLAGCPDVAVVGTAANGKIALQRLEQQAVDLLVLDLEMPEMNGQAVLEELRRRNSPVGAIMLSVFTAQGAKATLAALEAGAFDFVLKPSGLSMEANVEHLCRELRTKLAAYARCCSVKQILYGKGGNRDRGSAAVDLEPKPRIVTPAAGPPQVVALGISTGGPKALTEMVPQLPVDLPVPLLIVQHMPPVFTRSLADDLNNRTPLTVREGVDGQPICAGEVWIAPGGRQMKVQRQDGHAVLRITDDPSENSCRPSVDYLFRSVAEVYGGRAVGVIMTGMGNDGSLGCRRLKHCGAWIIAQDAATCVVFGMPREPIENGIADVVAPLGRIAAEIARLVRQGTALCK
ncbi:MAG: chemotaxis response regulator protein-glutamate methylesterase [Thermoguttaceae bacterium]